MTIENKHQIVIVGKGIAANCLLFYLNKEAYKNKLNLQIKLIDGNKWNISELQATLKGIQGFYDVIHITHKE